MRAYESAIGKNSGDLASLLQRHGEVNQELMTQKSEFGLFLEEWAKIPPERRKSLIQGPAEEMLKEMESVTGSIRERHQSWFPGSDQSEKTDAREDLSDVISLYRAFR